MKLACNIDRRGRRARLVMGIVVDLCGVGMILKGVFADSRGMLVGGVSLCAIGSFMIFEGLCGWCALRAMGIKIPM
jgi:hypothetical protein